MSASVVDLARLTDRTPMELASGQARFEALMTDTERRAYTMALQLTRNASEAEDLVQDTYLKAWKGFDTYAPGRPFINWLLRIMQRAYLDGRRRDNPIRRAESLHSMVSPSDGEVQEMPLPDPTPSIETTLISEERSADIRKALNDLPEIYRSTLLMCDVDELTYAEIAEKQKTTVGTVRSRIHRGRKILRETILSYGEAPYH